ncbi:hypothetical protein LWI29_034935 [Acer saccharum]|uniref:Uncharacterized protein n=1 Tax=Acer saccharum TaxID=4024 RepID=A0AA39VUQ3_ACESA|nr:hypothetical protein LWI29_034935 [Acer saccharum]
MEHAVCIKIQQPRCNYRTRRRRRRRVADQRRDEATPTRRKGRLRVVAGGFGLIFILVVELVLISGGRMAVSGLGLCGSNVVVRDGGVVVVLV